MHGRNAFLQRFGENCVAENIGELACGDAVALLDHWLYVRKCKPQRICDELPSFSEFLSDIEQFNVAKQETIEIFECEKKGDLCNWFQVLAVGKDVGKSRRGNRTSLHSFGVLRRHMNISYRKGDIVLCPNSAPRTIKHLHYSDFEFIVDEHVPLVRWRKTNG